MQVFHYIWLCWGKTNLNKLIRYAFISNYKHLLDLIETTIVGSCAGQTYATLFSVVSLFCVSGSSNPALSTLLDLILVDFADQVRVQTLPPAQLGHLR